MSWVQSKWGEEGAWARAWAGLLSCVRRFQRSLARWLVVQLSRCRTLIMIISRFHLHSFVENFVWCLVLNFFYLCLSAMKAPQHKKNSGTLGIYWSPRQNLNGRNLGERMAGTWEKGWQEPGKKDGRNLGERMAGTWEKGWREPGRKDGGNLGEKGKETQGNWGRKPRRKGGMGTQEKGGEEPRRKGGGNLGEKGEGT